ncbi:HipA family kinase [Rhizobium sp. L1K21]|uniref:HipA family kinase n=1 Tax=Rhizobium sp. L1K21 TaxID=2954933 RepID=UPI00209208E9|nr:HipA family kinase [Rhizobium sp. L1K21]MCO6184820.1 hypothetical protein [Rhizobium sp. L1K21]
MLACGAICQPSKVLREIQLFESSTRPARVETDAGDGFIKSIGNPQGNAALVSELIAAELGTWLGLSIPPFAVIRKCDIEIPMLNHHSNMLPPLFFSKAVNGIPRDGNDTLLKMLTNKSDVAKLVVFDTWIRNTDRYTNEHPNSDNLLYEAVAKGRKYSLTPIDHSHCFVDIDFDIDLPSDDLVFDPSVYGFYPEFEKFITPRSVGVAVEKLRTLEREFVQECVNSVPAEWGLHAVARNHLVDFVCRRATYVVDTISMKLVAAPELPGMRP